jgi:cell division protein FtsB
MQSMDHLESEATEFKFKSQFEKLVKEAGQAITLHVQSELVNVELKKELDAISEENSQFKTQNENLKNFCSVSAELQTMKT